VVFLTCKWRGRLFFESFGWICGLLGRRNK
jgi:hypothetical protein